MPAKIVDKPLCISEAWGVHHFLIIHLDCHCSLLLGCLFQAGSFSNSCVCHYRLRCRKAWVLKMLNWRQHLQL